MSDEAGKSELEQAVDGFLTTIRAASDTLKAATPAPAAPAAEPLSEAKLDQAADPQAGGSVGKAIGTFAREGVMPVVMDANTKMSNIRKEMAERDPATKPLMIRFAKEIEAEAKRRGGVLYTAEHGFEGLAIEIANRDPKYRAEVVEAEVQRRLAEEKAKQPAAAPTTTAAPARTEGVQAGAVAPTAPAAPLSGAAAISAIEVTAEDVEFNRKAFGISKQDVQKQRYEIEQLEKKYGAHGLRQLGGIPICTLAECGIPEPDAELDAQLEGRA
jgi:hypothetical protein